MKALVADRHQYSFHFNSYLYKYFPSCSLIKLLCSTKKAHFIPVHHGSRGKLDIQFWFLIGKIDCIFPDSLWIFHYRIIPLHYFTFHLDWLITVTWTRIVHVAFKIKWQPENWMTWTTMTFEKSRNRGIGIPTEERNFWYKFDQD